MHRVIRVQIVPLEHCSLEHIEFSGAVVQSHQSELDSKGPATASKPSPAAPGGGGVHPSWQGSRLALLMPGAGPGCTQFLSTIHLPIDSEGGPSDFLDCYGEDSTSTSFGF
jgi:hypothetical protein